MAEKSQLQPEPIRLKRRCPRNECRGRFMVLRPQDGHIECELDRERWHLKNQCDVDGIGMALMSGDRETAATIADGAKLGAQVELTWQSGCDPARWNIVKAA